MRPIIGTEVLANGTATRGALRWNYTAVHPTVYLPNGARRTLYTNTWAAWLWTARKGIVAGRAAAALYGVDWIDDTVPVELIARSRPDRRGVIIRDERIGSDEITSTRWPATRGSAKRISPRWTGAIPVSAESGRPVRRSHSWTAALGHRSRLSCDCS